MKVRSILKYGIPIAPLSLLLITLAAGNRSTSVNLETTPPVNIQSEEEESGRPEGEVKVEVDGKAIAVPENGTTRVPIEGGGRATITRNSTSVPQDTNNTNSNTVNLSVRSKSSTSGNGNNTNIQSTTTRNETSSSVRQSSREETTIQIEN